MQRRTALVWLPAAALPLAGCAAAEVQTFPSLAAAMKAVEVPAIARALQALREFEAHTGTLAPHFAYGALDKAQYTRAYLMHLANHWDEVKTGNAA